MLLDWHHYYCKGMELREVEQVQQSDRIKINGLESILFSYTTNEQSQKKINNPIYNVMKQKEYLGKALAKQVHHLYSENYKTFLSY